jgi:hypothetical protein
MRFLSKSRSRAIDERVGVRRRQKPPSSNQGDQLTIAAPTGGAAQEWMLAPIQ